LATHCVSHPIPEYFAGFFNDYGKFWAHCVSHHVEPKSGQDGGRRLLERLSQPSAQSLGLLVRRVLASPVRA
jgi:hypothetical protein